MNNTPLEAEEQAGVVEYLEMLKAQGKIVCFTANANSTWTPSKKQLFKNYQAGLRKGFPDLVVVFSSCLVLIEMKRLKGSDVSPEQEAWIAALNNINNVEARVCKGFEAAKAFIDEFI